MEAAENAADDSLCYGAAPHLYRHAQLEWWDAERGGVVWLLLPDAL